MPDKSGMRDERTPASFASLLSGAQLAHPFEMRVTRVCVRTCGCTTLALRALVLTTDLTLLSILALASLGSSEGDLLFSRGVCAKMKITTAAS